MCIEGSVLRNVEVVQTLFVEIYILYEISEHYNNGYFSLFLN